MSPCRPGTSCGTLVGHRCALKTVVEELAGDGSPGVDGAARLVDITPNVLGHRRVEPRGDARIHLQPLRVVDHGGRIDDAVVVVDEAELLEGEVEKGSTLAEVPFIRVEDDRNVAMDVDEAGGGMGLAGAAKGLVLSEETEPVGHAMAKKAEGQEDRKKVDTM